MFNRITKNTSRRILKSAIFLSILCLAFVGCENPASPEVKQGTYFDSLETLPAKIYTCKVDSLGREYAGQYRVSADLEPSKATKYVYSPEDQDLPLTEKDLWLISNVDRTKTPITCK